MPTWDENKRSLNIKKHNLDFVGCEAVFDNQAYVYEDSSEAYSEQRLCLVGWLVDQVVHMTYTEREDDFHVISLRKAEKHEIKRYIEEITR
jgi:uncharacterized protein